MSEYPFFDRDLSWLSFNYRVLMEAKDQSVPLLERLRFIAIYSSNLDEFFRVRVAGLRRFAQIGKAKLSRHLGLDPEEVIGRIHQQVERHLDEYGEALSEVLAELSRNGIHIHHQPGIPEEDRAELTDFFKVKVLAFLQPHFMDSRVPPFLKNRELYFGLRMIKEEVERMAILNIPSNRLPRFYSIKRGDTTRYYFLDDIIRSNISWAFPGFEILECCSVKLSKDADLQIDDEFSGDLVAKIEKQVKKRDLGVPSRFLYDGSMTSRLLDGLVTAFGLAADELIAGGRYHNLSDFFQISHPSRRELEYETFSSIRNPEIDRHASIFAAIDESDQILHFPYQPYDYILQFFNQAAIDPEVKEINATFYRMAERSVIGDALISAARNGKIVNVFMEVKARFDEENNLRWAAKMSEDGVNVRYSKPGLKVHAKVALVRKVSNGKTRFYGFFGTGNLNESTARTYCDQGLLTGHKGMTRELNRVFKFLVKDKRASAFQHLIVSQFGAMEEFIKLIDREIANKKKGKEARILLKLNNLEEPQMIRKLYEAAAAGVEVKILARSICCLVPQEGIEVSRIVDRFLEHSRIFYFHNDGKKEVLMGSSDWMGRNLHRRVEVTFRVYDHDIKKQVLKILELQFADNTKRTLIDKNQVNQPMIASGKKVRAQYAIYSYLREVNGR